MKKLNIKRIVAVALLVFTMTVGIGSGFAEAKTHKFSNGVKVEYGYSLNVHAKSYYKDGDICPHWVSVRIQETGQYAAKDTPFKGWTAKAKINPSTWRTYHYTVSAGLGYKK